MFNGQYLNVSTKKDDQVNEHVGYLKDQSVIYSLSQIIK